MRNYLIKLINNFDGIAPYADRIANWILFVLVLLLSYIAYAIIRPLLIKFVTQLTRKTKTHWDDVLLQQRFFHKMALLVPILILHFSVSFFTNANPTILKLVLNILEILFTLVLIQIFTAFLKGANTIYDLSKKGKRKSIKGYIQVVEIITYFVGVISIYSTLTGKDTTAIFTGLGAFAAILLLVFQDAIKGFASGVQLSANDMVRIGDWISMPKYGADGSVIDISLTTVKIQNWDKTISMVPSYALVSESFSNWRGMEESGGRRIKRSIFIDVNSIHFLSEDEKKEFSDIALLKDYIPTKDEEINQHNTKIENAEKIVINGRRLTNIGTFRKYLEEYIRTNNKINHNLTFMVRQLQSSEKGLPIEIYCFSKIQSWVEYEAIQADIFDHVFASVHTFNLKIFQNPTGNDFQSITSK